jgi:hypothetical protein
MAVDEVIIEDYSDITLIRGRTLNRVILRFFDQSSARHHTFLKAARAATRYRQDAVTVELLQPIFYVQGE